MQDIGFNGMELVKFYDFVQLDRSPEIAERTVYGSLPLRAAQYCHAITTATGIGWHIFPPCVFSLLFDGERVAYKTPDMMHFCEFIAVPFINSRFNAHAPQDFHRVQPAFLRALAEPGAVQIGLGFCAETRQGWSLMVKSPSNYPRKGYFLYEGIVATDTWFAPLFANVLLQQDRIYEFSLETPFLQLVPIKKATYSDDARALTKTVPVETWSGETWKKFEETFVKPQLDPCRKVGTYAVRQRRESSRRCPVGTL